MLAEERHNAIVMRVNQDGAVRVRDLSRDFSVTEDCIRKDLTLLEKRGLLRKTYGGAVKNRTAPHDFHVADRKDKNIEAKQRIAKKAFALVKDGDTVFLDISTANIELAKMLAGSGKRITLVTNCLDVVLAVHSTDNIRLICLGGVVGGRGGGFFGALTNEQIKNYRFDLAFIGVVGVDLEKNRVSTYVPEDGTTKRTAIENSSRSYMMLENRKFMEDGVYWYSSVSRFTGAILDDEPDETIRKKLAEYPIEWI